MPRQLASYGPFQARLFRRLDRLGILSGAVLAEELSFRCKRDISPVNVTHWRNGNSHLPMDVLVPLAELLEDSEGHSGVQLVFGAMLAELGHRAVPMAPEAADGCETAALHRALREASDVVSTCAQALDPDGPAGADLAPEEAAIIKREIAEARRAFDALEAHLDRALGAEPIRRRLG